MLIATAVDGLFYENGKVTPLITGAEQFMRENEVFTMAVSGDYIAIGTVRRGLVLVNRRSRLIKYFNERNGLQNNTVLSISFDKRNNLWLGLDNGIDYISLDTPFNCPYTIPIRRVQVMLRSCFRVNCILEPTAASTIPVGRYGLPKPLPPSILSLN